MEFLPLICTDDTDKPERLTTNGTQEHKGTGKTCVHSSWVLLLVFASCSFVTLWLRLPSPLASDLSVYFGLSVLSG
jgi:hypothetical protein